MTPFVIKGCSTCPDSAIRFNNGNGATTCAKLNDLIVQVGTKKPETRPKGCPLPTEAQAREKPLSQEALDAIADHPRGDDETKRRQLALVAEVRLLRQIADAAEQVLFRQAGARSVLKGLLEEREERSRT